MPSKELIEEIAFIIRHDKDGSPEDTARDILEVIHAALQEPNANQEQSGMREIIGGTGYVNHEIYIDPETPWHTWRAMLAASALGEGSEDE